GKGKGSKSGGKGGGGDAGSFGQMRTKGKGGPGRSGMDWSMNPNAVTPTEQAQSFGVEGMDGPFRGAPPAGFSGMGAMTRGGRGAPDAEAMAAAWFRRLDRDGDGVIRYDEMDDGLRAERERWDTNGDGVIDLREFTSYSQARMQQWQDERGQAP